MQFPLGCPDTTSTAEYNTSVGLGAWRSDFPSAETCTKIAQSASEAMPTPGMGGKLRGQMFGVLVFGMIFTLVWEAALNYRFVKPVQWTAEAAAAAGRGGGRGGGGGGGRGVRNGDAAFDNPVFGLQQKLTVETGPPPELSGGVV